MSKFKIGDHVEVIKEGYAIGVGRQGKVINITQEQAYRYCVIQAGDIIEAVPDIFVIPYVPGDNPRLIELVNNIKFALGKGDTEESRNFYRVFDYITNEEGVTDSLIAAVMYYYGKTQGIKKERQRAKEKTAHPEG